MPEGQEPGVTPGDPPSGQGGMPGVTPPNTEPAGGTPPATGTGGQGRGEPDPAAELRTALEAERAQRKRHEADVKRLQAQIDHQSDAGKSEAERERSQRERVEAENAQLRSELAQKETEGLARQVAAEAGIGHMWQRLQGDDLRALRADATRLREEMGMPGGALDGGVRGGQRPTSPPSMDDLIRSGARRR